MPTLIGCLLSPDLAFSDLVLLLGHIRLLVTFHNYNSKVTASCFTYKIWQKLPYYVIICGRATVY